MPITISGDGGIAGVTNLDGGDFECATLVASGDTTLGPQAVGRASLFVDDSANSVGINTTTPAAAVFLEVADGTNPIVSLNNTGNGEVRLGCTSTAGYIGTESNHPFNIETNSTTALTVLANGNIGIGTSSPSVSIHLAVSDPQVRLQRTGAYSTSSGPLIQFQGRGPNSTNYNFGKIQAVSSGSNNAGELQFFTNNAGSQSEHMRLDSSGNVGIGKASSGNKLEIEGQGDTKVVIDGRTDANNGSLATLELWSKNSSGTNNFGFLEYDGDGSFEIGSGGGGAGSVPLVFKTNAVERMRVLSGGGLTFNGDTAQANALDDYEEGTFTITIRENGNGTAWDTLAANNGYYTKIGDCVTFSATFNYSGVATNVNGGYYGWLAGFPFASSSSKIAGQFFISFLYAGVRTVLYSGVFIGGNAYAGIYKDQDATSPGTMRTNEYPTGAATVQFQGHYYV